MAELDGWGTPVWLAFHAIVVWSTLLGHTVTWAGRTYKLDRHGQVETITDNSDSRPFVGGRGAPSVAKADDHPDS